MNQEGRSVAPAAFYRRLTAGYRAGPQVLVVQAAAEAALSALEPEVEAISDRRLLTRSLLHFGQLTEIGCELKKSSFSNLAPHSSQSYS